MINSFLSDRSLSVHFDNLTSSPVPILSGVPQGSILGPFLFNLYLYDFPIRFNHSNSLLYADDTVVFSSHERPHDALTDLKSHLDLVTSFYKKWGIDINYKKCELICFRNASGRGHHLAVRESKQLSLNIEGNPIPLKQTTKYLGIYLHERLKMNHQARMSLSKSKAAASMLKLLLNSKHVEISTKKLMYKTLIRPLLSYSFLIWFQITPNVAAELQKFERKIIRSCISKYRNTSGKWYSNKTLYDTSEISPLLSYLTNLAKSRIAALQHHDNPILRDIFAENINFSLNDRFYISPISILSEGSSLALQIPDNDNLFLAPFYKKRSSNNYRG